MTLGNLVALTQDNVKRMLGLQLDRAHRLHARRARGLRRRARSRASRGCSFYGAAYTFMNLGAFAVIAALQKRTGVTSSARHVRGARPPGAAARHPDDAVPAVAHRHPADSPASSPRRTSSSRPSQAGGCADVLAVIAVLNAAAAAFYYLRVIVYMFMRDPASDAPPLRHGALVWGGLAAATALTILLRPVPDRAARVRRAGRGAPSRRCRRAWRALARDRRRPCPREPARERRQEPADVARRAETQVGARAAPPAGAATSTPWTATRVAPTPGPPARRGDHRLERVHVAQLVAERRRRARGRWRAISRSTASRLPPGRRRPQVDDGPAAIVGAARGRPGPRASTVAIAATTAARAAATSSAWRTWNATDGPLRSTNSHGGAPSSRATPAASISAGVAVGVERRVVDDRQTLRAPAARQRRRAAGRGRRGTRCRRPAPAPRRRRRSGRSGPPRAARPGRAAAIPASAAQARAGRPARCARRPGRASRRPGCRRSRRRRAAAAGPRRGQSSAAGRDLGPSDELGGRPAGRRSRA